MFSKYKRLTYMIATGREPMRRLPMRKAIVELQKTLGDDAPYEIILQHFHKVRIAYIKRFQGNHKDWKCRFRDRDKFNTRLRMNHGEFSRRIRIRLLQFFARDESATLAGLKAYLALNEPHANEMKHRNNSLVLGGAMLVLAVSLFDHFGEQWKDAMVKLSALFGAVYLMERDTNQDTGLVYENLGTIVETLIDEDIQQARDAYEAQRRSQLIMVTSIEDVGFETE